MKNKLGNNFSQSEECISVSALYIRGQQRAPKIVVCPPTEEMTEPSKARVGSLLKALSSRFSRRATDSDSMDSSCSSDSVSGECGRGDDHSSCTYSESGSDGSDRRRRHRSTVSLRRLFQTLRLTPRSQSCSPMERARTPKKQSQPKRILRSPVAYTYVRGLSGLPTQRVPRHMVCCPSMGLNR